MSKREIIAKELDHLPDQDLDKMLVFLRSLRDDDFVATLGAESALAKDWLTPEEDAAWAHL